MADYGPTRVHLVVTEGACTGQYKMPMEEPNAKKQEHVFEKAEWTVTPFMVYHNKDVRPMKPLIDGVHRKSQSAVGQKPVKMIFGRLGRRMDTLQVEQVLLRATEALGMPFYLAYCVTCTPACVPPRLKGCVPPNAMCRA